MLYVCYVTTPHVFSSVFYWAFHVVSRWNIQVSLWFIGFEILQNKNLVVNREVKLSKYYANYSQTK